MSSPTLPDQPTGSLLETNFSCVHLTSESAFRPRLDITSTELDSFLRSDLRPIWSEVGSSMVDAVGLMAPPSQPPLLCYGVLPVPMRGPPPWWAGNPLSAPFAGNDYQGP